MAKKLLQLCKCLMLSYVVTAIMLLIFALVLFKTGLSKGQVKFGIATVYAISCLCGGYLLARCISKKRIVCGALFGLVYFLIIFLVSIIVNVGQIIDAGSVIRGFVVCILAGLAGGFLTPVPK